MFSMKKNTVIFSILITVLALAINAFATQNPHKKAGEKYDKSCMTCHTTESDKVDTLQAASVTLCLSCHPGTDSNHILDKGIQHNGTKLTGTYSNCYKYSFMYKIVLPLSKGKIFCGTCHDPHEPKRRPAPALNDLPEATGKRGLDLCVVCHCKS